VKFPSAEGGSNCQYVPLLFNDIEFSFEEIRIKAIEKAIKHIKSARFANTLESRNVKENVLNALKKAIFKETKSNNQIELFAA
jgi:hypothetical protein